MQQVSTIIVDDEKKNTRILEHFLNTYCPKINIVDLAYSKKEAIKIINEKKPQLIFLDIVLGDGNGFEILEAIDSYSFKVIFVTSYEHYAIKAFKYNALDYILKPIVIEELIIAVNKVYIDVKNELFTTGLQLNSINQSLDKSVALDFIAVSSVDKVKFIKLSDILYLKADGGYTNFYIESGSNILSSKSLGEYEKIIDKNNFFRIHNSYIVHLKHVNEITKTMGNYCKMSNNKSLPIAKRRQESFSKFLKIK